MIDTTLQDLRFLLPVLPTPPGGGGSGISAAGLAEGATQEEMRNIDEEEAKAIEEEEEARRLEEGNIDQKGKTYVPPPKESPDSGVKPASSGKGNIIKGIVKSVVSGGAGGIAGGVAGAAAGASGGGGGLPTGGGGGTVSPSPSSGGPVASGAGAVVNSASAARGGNPTVNVRNMPQTLAKDPGMFEKQKTMFYKPGAVRDYQERVDAARTERRSAALSERLGRTPEQFINDFGATTNTAGMLKVIQDYSPMMASRSGSEMLGRATTLTQNLINAEKLTERGLLDLEINKELSGLARFGLVPGGNPRQPRINQFYANTLWDLVEQGIDPGLDNEKDFDESGNPRFDIVGPKVARAKQELLKQQEQLKMSMDEKALSALPPDQQKTVLEQRGANLGKTFRRSTTVGPDGTTIVEGYELNSDPDQRAARGAFDSSNDALSAITEMRDTIDRMPEAFDSYGWTADMLQKGGSLVNSATGKEIFSQDIRLARKNVDGRRNKLVQMFRGDIGKMDVKEEQRIINILSATDFWSNPSLAKQTLQIAEEMASAKGLLNFKRDPSVAGGEIPEQFKKSFTKPKIAASILNKMSLTDKEKQELFSNLQLEPIDTKDISILKDKGLIDDSGAIDFIVEGSFHPDKVDMSKKTFDALFPTNRYDPPARRAVLEEYMKRRNERKATNK